MCNGLAIYMLHLSSGMPCSSSRLDIGWLLRCGVGKNGLDSLTQVCLSDRACQIDSRLWRAPLVWRPEARLVASQWPTRLVGGKVIAALSFGLWAANELWGGGFGEGMRIGLRWAKHQRLAKGPELRRRAGRACKRACASGAFASPEARLSCPSGPIGASVFI